MKARNLFTIGIVALLFSGCVVYSFYPLYTKDDLFENDILLGEWFENDDQEIKFNDGESVWKFEHPFIGDKKKKIRDRTSYMLTLHTEEDGKKLESIFSVHVIELANEYFLDFYLEDFMEGEEVTLATFHVIPVHTFAKLTVQENSLVINWFDPDWMEELIRQNRIRIHHEETDDVVLLTAKPKELQKFVAKYKDTKDAFEDGLEVELHRK